MHLTIVDLIQHTLDLPILILGISTWISTSIAPLVLLINIILSAKYTASSTLWVINTIVFVFFPSYIDLV